MHCAATPLVAPPIAVTTPPGSPITGSALAGVVAPAGTTASVTGFTLPGSNTLIAPGPGAVPVIDPASGMVTGTIVVKPDGTYTFTPSPGYG